MNQIELDRIREKGKNFEKIMERKRNAREEKKYK